MRPQDLDDLRLPRLQERARQLPLHLLTPARGCLKRATWALRAAQVIIACSGIGKLPDSLAGWSGLLLMTALLTAYVCSFMWLPTALFVGMIDRFTPSSGEHEGLRRERIAQRWIIPAAVTLSFHLTVMTVVALSTGANPSAIPAVALAFTAHTVWGLQAWALLALTRGTPKRATNWTLNWTKLQPAQKGAGI